MVMDALLHNKEEVDLSVLYVDPIHDFAILKFDKDAIKYQRLSEVSRGDVDACLSGCMYLTDRVTPNADRAGPGGRARGAGDSRHRER